MDTMDTITKAEFTRYETTGELVRPGMVIEVGDYLGGDEPGLQTLTIMVRRHGVVHHTNTGIITEYYVDGYAVLADGEEIDTEIRVTVAEAEPVGVVAHQDPQDWSIDFARRASAAARVA